MNSLLALLFLLSVTGITVFSLVMEIYGAYLSFKKKWYVGAVALFIPGFAFVIGTAKAVFKKDLLA